MKRNCASCQLVAAGVGMPIGSWPIKAAAARRRSRGWSPTSATCCANWQAQEVRDVVIVPIGFISDHMEVIYDLDTEAKQTADGLGLNMIRAATVGTHPRFVQMIRELIEERTE